MRLRWMIALRTWQMTAMLRTPAGWLYGLMIQAENSLMILSRLLLDCNCFGWRLNLNFIRIKFSRNIITVFRFLIGTVLESRANNVWGSTMWRMSGGDSRLGWRRDPQHGRGGRWCSQGSVGRDWNETSRALVQCFVFGNMFGYNYWRRNLMLSVLL